MSAGTNNFMIGGRVFVATFAEEKQLLGAVQASREKNLLIADVFTPYAVHGLDQAMDLPPTRLPWACFGFGLFGAVFALCFQFWSMTRSWPMDVGGKPWNSIPAYVPVTFEVMVLMAGVGVFLAFLLRCRLLPGRRPGFIQGLTSEQFVLVLDATAETFDWQAAQHLCNEFDAIHAEEREG
jgi:hypothetical protein